MKNFLGNGVGEARGGGGRGERAGRRQLDVPERDVTTG